MPIRNREGSGIPPGGETQYFEEEVQYFRPKVKFEVYGEEMLEKEVKSSGNTGRVYLPPDWVGRHIKVIRTN